MTSTNLHLTIVLSLIGINTIGAVLYFFYGFFKTVKTGKPKKEQAVDENEQTAPPIQNSFAKYALQSVFILLCPIVAPVFLLLGNILYRLIFRTEIDLAAITFSKERVNVIELPDMEEEINLVPMEEAVLIEDKENLRHLLLNVLRGDITKSIHAVTKALNSSDSEASHYAASAIMDIIAEFQRNTLKFQSQLENDPNDAEVNALFIDYLDNMLHSGIFSEMELKTYTYMLEDTVENMHSHNPAEFKTTYFCSVINALTKIGDLQRAEKWVEQIQNECPDDIEMYRCVLRYYFETKNKEQYFKFLQKLKSSTITIDKDLLELIRIFN